MSTSEPGPVLLAFLDTETTGLDPCSDRIVEIAVLLTEPEPPWAIVGRRDFLVPTSVNAGWDETAREMAEASGLMADLERAGNSGGQRAGQVGPYLARWINHEREQRGGGDVWIAGSGVAHFDRAMIEHQMPALAAVLSYRTLDVGEIRRALRVLGLDPPAPSVLGTPHRALPDAVAAHRQWSLIADLLLGLVGDAALMRAR